MREESTLFEIYQKLSDEDRILAKSRINNYEADLKTLMMSKQGSMSVAEAMSNPQTKDFSGLHSGFCMYTMKILLGMLDNEEAFSDE